MSEETLDQPPPLHDDKPPVPTSLPMEIANVPIADPRKLVTAVLALITAHPQLHDEHQWIDIGEPEMWKSVTTLSCYDIVAEYPQATLSAIGWLATCAGWVWTSDDTMVRRAGELTNHHPATIAKVLIAPLLANAMAGRNTDAMLAQLFDSEVSPASARSLLAELLSSDESTADERTNNVGI